MRPKPTDELLLALQSKQPTISFRAFKERLYRRYIHAPHLELIDHYLEQAVKYAETQGREGIGRLIFSMPPRHGKTVNISRLFPAWLVGRNPDWRIILTSYGATLADKNSRLARNFVASPEYRKLYPHVNLALDSKSAASWDVAGYEGGVDAMGVGGGVTGKGAHFLIIDDPVKNREEAESEVIREKVWDWYSDDAFTRLEPGGVVIIIMTRWHMDDLVGRLLKHEPQKWTVINLPALAKENDLLGRSAGEALWPERYPLATLQDIQSTLGTYSFSALYQQEPTPAEGGIFKREWMHIVDSHPELTSSVRYWDLAMSSKTTADYTVGVKLAQAVDGHYYIVDVKRFQKEWGDVVPEIARIAIEDGNGVIVGVEEAGYMSRAVTELNTDDRMKGHAVFGYPVDKDKVTRALPFAARLGAGQVSILNRHWTQDYIDELLAFTGKQDLHDDQVDASSGAWAMIADSSVFGELNFAKEYTFAGTY